MRENLGRVIRLGLEGVCRCEVGDGRGTRDRDRADRRERLVHDGVLIALSSASALAMLGGGPINATTTVTVTGLPRAAADEGPVFAIAVFLVTGSALASCWPAGARKLAPAVTDVGTSPISIPEVPFRDTDTAYPRTPALSGVMDHR